MYKAEQIDIEQRLTQVRNCANTCLHDVNTPIGFSSMCGVLIVELNALCGYLSTLRGQFQEHLPLSAEEPKGVNWGEWGDDLRQLKAALSNHAYYLHICEQEMAAPLADAFDHTADELENIEQALAPKDDSVDKFADYAQQELAFYKAVHKSALVRRVQNELSGYARARRPRYYMEQLRLRKNMLKEAASFVLNKEQDTLYWEELGCRLWQLSHHADTESITLDQLLDLVMQIEYFSSCLPATEKEVVRFVHHEPDPTEQTETDAATEPEAAPDDERKQCLDQLHFRLSNCADYFTDSFTIDEADRLIADLLQSDCRGEIVSRLTTAAMPKFVGSLVGVLKAAGRIHGSHPQLAKALDFRSINPDTVSSYISKGKRELPATLRFVLAWHPSAR